MKRFHVKIDGFLYAEDIDDALRRLGQHFIAAGFINENGENGDDVEEIWDIDTEIDIRPEEDEDAV